MKIPYKKAAAAIVAIALLLSSSAISLGQFQTPAYLRVGLYYKDASVNTALPIFDVSAAAGIQAGLFINNTFTEIYREPSAATLYARKDTYFYNTGSTLKEYNPSSTSADSIASFAKYGPYHIKIGSDCPDQATAAAQVSAYRQAGVQAYIAYCDAWQVWVGSYLNEAAAQADVAAISPLLGEIGYTVVPPAANRIVLVDGQYQPLCIFGSNAAYFQLRPAPENNPPVLSIKGNPYRGALEVRRLAESDMTVINHVSVRDYLYGNVPAEIGGRSPAEAIKAQALASKMYAINNMGKHAKTGFDLCPTTSCQVYKGYGGEVAQCNEAIDQVKDLVITYDGKLAGAIFYFASSGGRTEDVRNVWGSTYPYLVSVEDKYEKIYSWTKVLRASDIKAKLPQLGNILGVSITQTAESGRVTQLAVRGDSRSDPALYLREKCRTLFGLDSQLYTITSDADVYTAAYSHIPAAVALVPAAPVSSQVRNSGAETSVKAPDAIAMLPAANTGMSAEDYDRMLAKQIALNQSGDSAQAGYGSLVQAAGDIVSAAAGITAIASASTATNNATSVTGTEGGAGSASQIAAASETNTAGVTGTVSASGPASVTDMTTAAASSGTTSASGISSNSAAGILPPSASASGSAINASTATPAAIATPPAMKLTIPLPVTVSPSKTQLGGMKVATANGVTSLRANNNKITILGAGGAVRTATLVPETYTFSGKGWGHAVGMSQEGAIGMGKAGISFDQILKHYFQGTELGQG